LRRASTDRNSRRLRFPPQTRQVRRIEEAIAVDFLLYGKIVPFFREAGKFTFELRIDGLGRSDFALSRPSVVFVSFGHRASEIAIVRETTTGTSGSMRWRYHVITRSLSRLQTRFAAPWPAVVEICPTAQSARGRTGSFHEASPSRRGTSSAPRNPPLAFLYRKIGKRAVSRLGVRGPVAGLVGIEGGVVSGVFNLESPGAEASGRRPRHEECYQQS
jgi:hypothetical protein